MKEMNGIGEFIAHMALMDVQAVLSIHEGLKKCAMAVEKTAKEEIGVYQGDAPPFGAWPELADVTKEDRLNKGFTENDPLLRTGGLRDSIGRTVDGLEAAVGSTREVMVWQELGTEKIPPRPVLGTAAVNNIPLIKRTLGIAVANGLLYGSGNSFTLLE